MLDEGFAAGLRYLGIDNRVILYAEWEAYPCAVLESRMDEGSIHAAPIWCGDFTALDGKLFRGLVDAIVAGFPCQDLSVAGKRAGLDGKRSGLFFEIVKFADDCEARFMFLENVAGIASATASVMDETEELEERAASRVLGELADRGWDAEWLTLSASDVGASHGRARWFCFAWRQKLDDSKGGILRDDVNDKRTSSGKIDGSSGTSGMLGNSEHTGFDASEIGDGAQPGNDGFQTGAVNACEPAGSSFEYGQVGNAGFRDEHQGTGEEADSERITGIKRSESFVKRRRSGQTKQTGMGDFTMADTSKPGSQGNEFGKPCDSNWGGQEAYGSVTELCSLFAPGPSDQRWDEIIREHPERAPALESSFCKLVNGLAFAMDDCRAARLKCVGNGVVALQAGYAAAVLIKRSGILRKAII